VAGAPPPPALIYDARMRIACALFFVIIAAPLAHADDSAAITTELQREAAAWNRGDLDGYLSGYERAPTTTMVGSKLLRGWDAIAAMYRTKYGDKAHMGTLTFSELDVRPLAADWALVVGHWALARDAAAGGPVGGWFTLTLHKGRDGWRIVVDHTS
jgi:ketosteroid isomerase-like protein